MGARKNGQSQEPYRVAFQDSSDDEQHTQVAEIVPVIGGDGPLTPVAASGTEQQQQQSWLNRALGGAGTFFTSLLVDWSGTGTNEPFDMARVTPSPSSGSGHWGYGGGRDTPQRMEVESVDPSEDIAVDLREVILQYRRTPDEVYLRIILAALYFGEVQINGDVLRAAAGSRELIMMLLKSDKVNVDDLDVQQIIQAEIDAVMVPALACGSNIAQDTVSYLALLCRVPSATLTKEQVRLCHNAGFDFIKVLHENPHVLRNISPPRWIVARFLDICYILDMVMTWFGLIATLLGLMCVAWLIYFWISNDYPRCGYWTILCYVIGYVVSIVVVMVSEQGRIRDYEDRLWDYPDNTLKVVPCIPVFEIALMYVTLRYELLRENGRYFVIRYDLYNGLSNVLIIHTFFFATPQLLVQYYISRLYEPSSLDFIGYKLLVGVNYALYGMSMYIFLRKVLFNYSCNSYGFAVVALKQAPVMSVDITTRILIVMTVFYLECNVVAVILSISFIKSCEVLEIILISVAAVVTVLNIVGLAMTLIFDIPKLIWVVALIALFMQIAYSAFVAQMGSQDISATCTLFAINAPIVSSLTYVTFGFFCVSFIAWVVVLIYSELTGRKKVVQWDNYHNWSRAR
ncbi:hypothetical protein DQ04_01301060 [Trypanosoma grayi]|uniref:hypothetical protein n=1 Tax=Trypanosoma grayi TaxID=71804 RepID=UPI0004F43A8A|nr:hypothetical protein DQ04_01301060 [Trypanosoma grayi]KEG12962.1 hypothetical protein DQ04_01301060 [Trypanosoma grayi]